MAASQPIRPVREESVSERLRREKELLLGNGPAVPITGQYYDAIRATQQVRTSAPRALTNAFVRGINNKAGGVRSFAAANYQYPSGQMVIGASLQGFSSSPSEDRKRQMAKLMGLGGIPNPELASQIRMFVGILGIAKMAGLKIPADVEVGDQLCDVNAALNGAADYIAANGLDTPIDTSALSTVIDDVQSGDFGRIAGAVGRASGLIIAITRSVAPLVGACRTKPSAAPPPQAAPPQAAPPATTSTPGRLSPSQIANILNRGRGGIVRPSIIDVRKLGPIRTIGPVAPAIPGPTSSSGMNAGIIAAGVAVVGAAAYFFMRRKGSASAA